MTTKARNSGIDLLRILAVFSVVVFYVTASGPMFGAGLSFGNFSLAWLLETLVLPALNVFVLIAGFVGYRAGKSYPKTKSILRMLLVALFYSVIICILFKIISPASVGGAAIIKSLLPFTSGAYWFLSAYLILCLFMPLLNRFVSSVSNRTLLFVLLVFLSVFSVYGVIPSLFGGFLDMNAGMGAVWFFVLYLLGAFMKKIDLPKKFSRKNYLLALGGCYLLTYLFLLIFGSLDVTLLGFPLSRLGFMFTSSLSPTMVLAAVSLVCIFAECKLNKNVALWVGIIFPSVLPIYLIHANTYVLSGWFIPLFLPLAGMNPFLSLILTLVYSVCVFAVCFIVDMLRRILFNVIMAETAVDKIDTIVKDAFSRIAAFANEKLGL